MKAMELLKSNVSFGFLSEKSLLSTGDFTGKLLTVIKTEITKLKGRDSNYINCRI